MNNRKIADALLASCFLIGAGAFLFDVEKSSYFPVFVVFAMIYGPLVGIYWLKGHGRA